jgi:hypothetical protein
MPSWRKSRRPYASKRGFMTKAKISSDDKKPLTAFGYQLDESGAPIRPTIPPSKPGQDYGCDPLGGGRFRMVPSGDIVDYDERNRRLAGRTL